MKSPFKNMVKDELEKKIADLKMQSMKLNSELASKAAGKNVGQLGKLKKSIAQAKTALSMLQHDAAIAKSREKKAKTSRAKPTKAKAARKPTKKTKKAKTAKKTAKTKKKSTRKKR